MDPYPAVGSREGLAAEPPPLNAAPPPPPPAPSPAEAAIIQQLRQLRLEQELRYRREHHPNIPRGMAIGSCIVIGLLVLYGLMELAVRFLPDR